MATVHAQVNVPPERVFAVLRDPQSYADWVVGSDSVRAADPSWPAVGSRFYHRVGVGLLKVNDHTEVVDLEPERKLVLHARARPLGTALVTMLTEPRDSGTYVTMSETAGDLLSHLGLNPLTDWLVHLRNAEALRRLKRIAETGTVQS